MVDKIKTIHIAPNWSTMVTACTQDEKCNQATMKQMREDLLTFCRRHLPMSSYIDEHEVTSNGTIEEALERTAAVDYKQHVTRVLLLLNYEVPKWRKLHPSREVFALASSSGKIEVDGWKKRLNSNVIVDSISTQDDKASIVQCQYPNEEKAAVEDMTEADPSTTTTTLGKRARDELVIDLTHTPVKKRLEEHTDYSCLSSMQDRHAELQPVHGEPNWQLVMVYFCAGGRPELRAFCVPLRSLNHSRDPMHPQLEQIDEALNLRDDGYKHYVPLKNRYAKIRGSNQPRTLISSEFDIAKLILDWERSIRHQHPDDIHIELWHSDKELL
ncbi:hypothetical protein LTR64_008075 [Lithohypha guttulata]|uniref:uncharacterized protein n=1 Tax=Lithohypha guttulata TaxID=1690604 RepID=UPI00315CE361